MMMSKGIDMDIDMEMGSLSRLEAYCELLTANNNMTA